MRGTGKWIYCFIYSFLFPCLLSGQEIDLDYFIRQCLHNSPALRDFQNQIRSGRIDSLRIGSVFGPQVNITSNNYVAPVINGWGFDEIITDKAYINAQISVSKEITGARRRDNLYQSVHNQQQSIVNNMRISEQQLVKEVTDQYIAAWGLKQQLSYEYTLISLLKDETTIFKKLTEQNIYSQTDYLSLLLTVQQQELQAAQTKNQYKNSMASLNYLCGIGDTTSFSLAEPLLDPGRLIPVSDLLYFQSFINDSLKLINDYNQINLEYKPKINIFGDAGYFSSLNIHPERNFGAGAGINLTVPIYDGHQKRMQIDKNLIAEQTRQGYRDFYIMQFNQQMNELFRQLSANRQLDGLIEQQVIYAGNLVDANHKLLEKGEVRVADYLIAVSNYLTSTHEQVRNKVERYLIISQINYWNQTK